MFAYDRLDLGLSLMNSEPGVAKSRSSENSISDTDNRSSTKTNDSNNIFKHTHTIENCFHFPIGNWKPVSPSPTTSIRFPATAKDDGFSEDFIAEYQKDLEFPKTKPKSNYQCRCCGVMNDHRVEDCELKNTFSHLTPYQGDKKCFGEYKCDGCRNKWVSKESYANTAQTCRKCFVDVYPRKQYSSERAVELKLLQLASHRYKKRCPTDGSSQRNQEK